MPAARNVRAASATPLPSAAALRPNSLSITLVPAELLTAEGNKHELRRADGNYVVALYLCCVEHGLAVDFYEIASGGRSDIICALAAVVGDHCVVLAGDLHVAVDVHVAYLAADVVVARVQAVVHAAGDALDADQPADNGLGPALDGLGAYHGGLEGLHVRVASSPP